jgi:uncharacterized protein YhfF
MTVQQFWEEYCHLAGLDPLTPYQRWYFGNSTEMASELVGLVVAGKKTATASLVETNRREPQNAPVDGGYSVVTDLEGEPKCIIQTVEVRDLPFREIDAQFAFDEGEGDRTLEAWRDAHWEYFSREAAAKGFTFDENTLVCCERFKLLYP